MTKQTDLQALGAEAQRAISTGDWPQAERALRRLIAGGGASAALSYNLALVLRRQDRREEAVACFDAAIARDPGHGNARFERAAVLLDDGRLDAALAGFRDYLALTPDDPDALLNAGRLALRLGENAAARDYGDRLLARRPDAAAKLLAAEAAAEAGDATAALAGYKAVLATDDLAARAAALSAMSQHPTGRMPLRLSALADDEDQSAR